MALYKCRLDWIGLDWKAGQMLKMYHPCFTWYLNKTISLDNNNLFSDRKINTLKLNKKFSEAWFNPFASEAVYTQIFFLRPPVGQRVNTHSFFWEFFRKPCQHATRVCDKRWMTCIHAGVSHSPREHASVPPDKRHCRQWMSSLFCGFLPNPFIHDLFCWSSRHKFVKTDL